MAQHPPADGARYASFEDFYPYYIHEHANPTCRRIHVVGTGLATVTFLLGLFTLNLWMMLAAVGIGYGFAWIGHFFFEKNRPATFHYPLWSLRGDFQLFWETVSGERRF